MAIEKGLKQEFPLEKITKDYKLTSAQEPKEIVPKVLPQAQEIEIAVLSAMIIDPDCIPNVVEILKPECFYKEEHQIIYRAIVDLFTAGKSVDLFLLTQELKKNGLLEKVGGAAYLTEISNAVATSANVQEYARVIHDKYILRELIRMSNIVANLAFKEDTDAFELLDFTEQKLLEISAEKFKSEAVTLKKSLKEVLEKYEVINREKRHLTGVPSGFPEIDALTGGFQKSDLIIIAGRPGMGKTAFALSIARNAAVEGKVPVGIFSLEMSLEQITLRLICMETNVDMHALRTGRLTPEEWQKISGLVGRISDAPIFIDDTPALSTLELRAKARRLKAEHDIGLIIVDYLQLMQSPKAESREREISMISRSLKSLAKELEIPVIALSQLRRAVEERGDKRPMLSDLRESGCLTGDTLILNAETGELIPIKEVAEKKLKFKVLTINEHGHVEPKKLLKAFYSGKKLVYLLKTRTGREIKASANHPFYTFDGWKALEELEIGERIALPKEIRIEIKNEFLSDDEVIFLAHLLGAKDRSIHYIIGNSSSIRFLTQIVERLFGVKPKVAKEKGRWIIYLPTSSILNWFDKLGYDLAEFNEKGLPSCIFKLSNNKIALFLHHFLKATGNVSFERLNDDENELLSMCYSTTSEILARQVQHLLLRVGVQSCLEKEQKKSISIYRVYIRGDENIVKFLIKIKHFGKEEAKVKMIWQNIFEARKLKQMILLYRFSEAMAMVYKNSNLPNHSVILRGMVLLNNLNQRSQTKNDIFWDEVVEIKPLGVEDVYDATIEENHNFLANDIFVHNSLEQDADVVIFVHRPEYYGITAYEDGAPTEGTAEIIISKQRNGPIGSVRLSFLKHSTKFARLEISRREFEEEPFEGPLTPGGPPF